MDGVNMEPAQKASTHPAVHHISRCSIKPECVSDESNQPFHLNPWDLSLLNIPYIQKGLLFSKPPPSIIDHLKDSLSLTLTHFLPLAGHLVTHKQDNPSPSYSISVEYSNNNNNPGVEFVHAVAADVSVADVLSPSDVHVPPIVQSLFLLDEAISHDGHTLPLLAVQVTELVDGIFIACSFNHVVGDGTSYWNFFNAWAEICRKMMVDGKHVDNISCPPVLTRWFLDDENGHVGPIINLPFSHHDEFIHRYVSTAVLLRERVFHFSPQSIAKLKAKANAECNTNTNTSTISSFQALSALVWRCVTRARRHLPSHQKTSCSLAINNRSRLNPPLSPDYFGNCVQAVSATVTVEELLSHGIGWAAWLLHEAVNEHNDSKVRRWVEGWMVSPSIYKISDFINPCSVMLSSSPRFNMYGCDFGWGKAEAVRSGSANKMDGSVTSYPGRHGVGSVDLEVSLLPESMTALDSDPEFMDAVSLSLSHHHQ
ncbi:protein ENHANCED PSEUDOMONAS SUSCEPTIBILITY 1-like [Telopea speciosissima]|uniref:protein ENHANCED PSEUDOMONAS SUSCEPTIBILITY 1-like n=1 Tax=Telopea speciosissima TaxID=54955 RepID=UPI001CC34636|nr:protein ENHANCED PSEUDOMONAS SUSCEPTIBILITY 1-like [Telopea speciosissima]